MSASFFDAGLILFLALLPFVAGFFAPKIRIAYHLWRGNYAAAARTLERVLERHPERLNLYTRLANLYLRLGRQDERAMKVYKKILLLNLATPDHEEINVVVARKYLNAETLDADAIEVLENALQNELRKSKLPVPRRISLGSYQKR
jgi:tetratricopeptide (TPR) repeat protein